MMGVTANSSGPAADQEGWFNPAESSLYFIHVAPGVGTASARLLGQVPRYDPDLPADQASLTSLAYFPGRPGYLWTTDRVRYFVNDLGVRVPDSNVYIDGDGNGHRGGSSGPILHEVDLGYRLSQIRLSSGLIVADGQGTVTLQTLLCDSDLLGHPFWIYEDVRALDFDNDGTLYAVATLRSLAPELDPVPDSVDAIDGRQLWLVEIEDTFSVLDEVSVVTRVAQLTTDQDLNPLFSRVLYDINRDSTGVSTISFNGNDVLYGIDANSGELFTFDTDPGGYLGTVTDIGVVPLWQTVIGIDHQADYVSMVPGYGDGTFGPVDQLPTGDGPYLAPLVDLNRDGFLDILTANEFDDTVSVRLSQTDFAGDFVGFGPEQIYPVGEEMIDYGPVAIATGRISADSSLDVVVANRDNDSITVIFGSPTGILQAGLYSPGSFTLAQLNDDDGDFFIDGSDYIDLVSVNPEDDTVSVFMGNGDGTFSTVPVTYAVGSSPQAAEVFDVNRDMYPDLVVVNQRDSTVTVLFGYGNGLFYPGNWWQDTYFVGTYPGSVALGDLNGDMVDDMAVINVGSGSASILLGTGTGGYGFNTSFQAANPPEVDVGYRPLDAAIADVDGDGATDLVVTNRLGSVSVLLGNNDGTFMPRVSYATGRQPVAVELVDLNLDGHPDIVTADWRDNTVSVLRSVVDAGGIWTFEDRITFDVGEYPTAMSFTQLDDDNGDGVVDGLDNIDLVVANSNRYDVLGGDTVSLLLGNGDGTFQTPATTYDVGDAPSDVEFADVNLDGVPDILVSNYDDKNMSILLGDDADADGIWDGTFTAQPTFNIGFDPITIPVGDEPVAVAVADLNRDRLADVVVANRGDDNIVVMLGDGTGAFPVTFTYTPALSGDPDPTSLALGDLNWDGVFDLVVGLNGDDAVAVMLGVGNGSFGAATYYDVGHAPTGVALGDMNGDEKLELLVANTDDTTPNPADPRPNISFLLGVGDGTFMQEQTLRIQQRAAVDRPGRRRRRR